MATKNNKSKTATSSKSKLRVDAIIHEDATRKNIPTAEFQSIMQNKEKTPIQVAYERRNKDLDPQLVWRGKDLQDWSDLVVSAPPLYIQEKVHPKVIIDDLIKRKSKAEDPEQIDLFSDFNGLPNEGAKTEFYQHEAHWTNRMILGDSLQVMASLAEREGLRGKVQCIYFDPPYGIKFNSNFQWSTTSREIRDESSNHITREPEQVKAFRDTWRDGINSYLTYMRDRLVIARDLLSDSGSIFLQISNENVHYLRCLLDEVFGEDNAVSTIIFKKASPESSTIKNSFNYILWYSKDKEKVKVRKLYRERELSDGTTEDPKKLALWALFEDGTERPLTTDEKREEVALPPGTQVFRADKVRDSGQMEDRVFGFQFKNENLWPGEKHCWRGDKLEMERLKKAERLLRTKETLAYKYFIKDNWGVERTNIWEDTAGKIPDMRYVVETNEKIISRCILLSTDPGDLVLDPTCGSGTTAFSAEKWGRRWVTIDTSRVALALARGRIMGASFPYFLLSDSSDGIKKQIELGYKISSDSPTITNNIKFGFVCQKVPHIKLKNIANNTEIDKIWDTYSPKIQDQISKFNKELKANYSEWEIPKQIDENWSKLAIDTHKLLIQLLRERKIEIDSSILKNADFNYLYDRPYADNSKIRVAGPFTIESVSPHRVLSLNEDNSIIEQKYNVPNEFQSTRDFIATIVENLKKAGVQQAHKEDKIMFSEIAPWPGTMICAEAKFIDSKKEKRAAILIGPEFGTVSRADLVEAAKEAAESDFQVLIACAFNFDARSTELSSLGKIPVLKARMNADLHMAEDLKSTGKGNLFVVFGEPDIEIKDTNDTLKVKINGVDVFHPNTGEVRSDGADGIACWMIDTDYNEESFFVRHAYFLGANDPYKSLKSSLKAEIEGSAWESLNSDVSRPFKKPKSGRIAVKVINHLGDEVMKVFKV